MKLTISLLFLTLIFLVESKYEIILDRRELPLKEKEQIVDPLDCRVKKFNRST